MTKNDYYRYKTVEGDKGILRSDISSEGDVSQEGVGVSKAIRIDVWHYSFLFLIQFAAIGNKEISL